MHYRHSFHAGNFADVFKHALLCGLIEALRRKDTPWCYLDTHAGAGRYVLDDEGAARTGEWREGVARLQALDGELPPMLRQYLDTVSAATGGGVSTYPGSPLLVAQLARAQDRLVLCERVPQVVEELRTVMKAHRAAIHPRDGYEAASLLPPAEKRGLVLIDPPFEREDEFDAIADLLVAASRRFATGIYAAWYPLKAERVVKHFIGRVVREVPRPLLDLRLDTGARAPVEGVNFKTGERFVRQPMSACGLLVVNPPFGFDGQARALLEFLAPRLAQGMGASCAVSDPRA